MQIQIELLDIYMEKCRRFASFRRTLTTAMRCCLNEETDPNIRDTCVDELEEIIPAIEALQLAVRAAVGLPESKNG